MTMTLARNDETDATVVQPTSSVTSALWTTSLGPVQVLVPQGVFDRAASEQLDRHFLDRALPAIVDLTECTLTDLVALRSLDPARWGRPAADVCLACRRITSRCLLASAGVGDRLALFQSTQDAAQAWIMADAGYGSGWGC